MNLDKKNKLIRDLYDEYYSVVGCTLSRRSAEHYKQEFTNFLKWAMISDILETDQVTDEVAERYIRYSYSIKRSAPFEIATLKRIWSVCLPGQYNPWTQKLYNLLRINTETPMNHRPFTHKECVKIFSDIHGEWRYALMFAYWYGMRIGSVCNLKWKDFKGWKRTKMFVHLPPKTARVKPVYLELPIVPEIEWILTHINKLDNEYVFPTMKLRYEASITSMCHFFKATTIRCRIKDTMIGIASMHSFRTTFVTRMDEAGAPSYITDSITGHAARDMHGLYSRPSARAKRKWIMKAIKPIGIEKLKD